MAHATGLERIIQEYVPGKQLSLAHIVASPTRDLYEKLGLIRKPATIYQSTTGSFIFLNIRVTTPAAIRINAKSEIK